MKLWLFLIGRIWCGLLEPNKRIASDRVVFYSSTDFAKLGGCLAHATVETLEDVKETFANSANPTRNDGFEVALVRETAVSKITVSANATSAGFLTCWDKAESATVEFAIAIASLATPDPLAVKNATRENCQCDLVRGDCECCCDSDCEKDLQPILPCPTEAESPMHPWFVVRDNSFLIGSFFPATNGTIPVQSAVLNNPRICGDFYCPGDDILTDSGLLEFELKDCDTFSIPIGHKRQFLCRFDTSFIASISQLVGRSSFICVDRICSSKLPVSVMIDTLSNELVPFDQNDPSFTHFSALRIGTNFTIEPDQGVRLQELEIVLKESSSLGTSVRVSVMPFVSQSVNATFGSAGYLFGGEISTGQVSFQNCQDPNFAVRFGDNVRMKCALGVDVRTLSCEDANELINQTLLTNFAAPVSVMSGVGNSLPYNDEITSILARQVNELECSLISGVIFTFIYERAASDSYMIKALKISVSNGGSLSTEVNHAIDFMTEFEEQRSRPSRSWQNPFSCAQNEVCWTLYPPNTSDSPVAPLLAMIVVYIIVFLWYYAVRDTESHVKVRVD